MVDRFQRHTAGQTTIANHSDNLAVLLEMIAGQGHTYGKRNRCRAVPGNESIMVAFAGADETAQTFELSQTAKFVATPGEHLVHISLVTDIPENEVVGRGEYFMQGDGYLHHPEV
ncbi:MAG: hypothetical protein BWY75_02367 [bacterium ADurb.Bin425]|nr:MAG: hypothetical protein BWY75_02367 [bacterium ADurb.Bin425]